jgi:GxxExxY protein
MQHAELTGTIIKKAIQLHQTIGPGQTQARYAKELAAVLRDADLALRRRVKSWQQTGERWHLVGTLDLVVEDLVGVSVTTRNSPPGDRARGHLRRMVQARGLPVGLVLNFGPHRVDIGRVDERGK